MNADEFRRVLKSSGRLLVAVPGPEDLQEIWGMGRDLVERTCETFASRFVLAAKRRVTHSVELSPDALRDVQLSTYRGAGPLVPGNSPVTFSLDLLLFTPRAA
jgi:hypothetical protein